ncbi:cellular tumor antigen p53 isoform X2 [Ceratitis capitata]|uniref:cellular tumor antigen p53 isoform X2 n=1 Tax=Ceratitis capitata TaxID=7213 RepID=UPI0003299302|nr:cellular tumor antigen p53 isoform X2 [Ceratitis capitata]
MIRDHFENSAISRIKPSVITVKNTTISNNGSEDTYVNLGHHPQSEVLQRFLNRPEEEMKYNSVLNQLDIFASDANSGYEQLIRLEKVKPLPLTPENYPNSVLASEYSCSSNQTNKDTVMEDIIPVSDASNPPEDLNKEEDVIPSDEPYSYLQGLNSDNLMAFSQQSAIQELLLKEQLDVKSNLDILPTFEEHDNGGYKFDIQVGTNRKTKKTWMYSSNRKKLYIRMHEIFTLEAVYAPKLPLQQLRVRVLLSFKNEVSEPVLRCQNHLSKDTESNQTRRESLLRCENPTAEYCGTSEGKNINDRYSIIFPLGLSVMPRNDCPISQTIAIKFTCQNSCIGRRETSLIFLLEGMSGEILSQRVMDVKICSCPKRDYEADERNCARPSKRKANDIESRKQKIAKVENVTRKPAKISIKDEDTSSDSDNSDSGISISRDLDLQLTPSGEYRLSITLEKDLMEQIIQNVNQAVALKIYKEPQQAKHYNKMCRQLLWYSEKFQRK